MLLQTIDGKWREHLLTLEHLRSVVGFRGYAQRDPLNEYKTEAFQLFESMLDSLREDVTQKLGQIRPMTEDEQQAMMQQMMQERAALQAQTDAATEREDGRRARRNAAAEAAREGFDETDPATWGNPGRNNPAPAGRARSSSIATGAWPEPDRRCTGRHLAARMTPRRCHTSALFRRSQFLHDDNRTACGGSTCRRSG